MCIKQFARYSFLCSLFLISSGVVFAGVYRAKGETAHYIGFSVAGAEANNILSQSEIETRVGGAANVKVHYELHQRGFIFLLGIKAQYQYTQNALGHWMDVFDRLDRNAQPMQYQYVYSNWRENHSDIRLTMPMQLGYEFDNMIYCLLGAQFSFSLLDKRSTFATMATQGVYPWSIEPIQTSGLNDFTSFGYYPEAEYSTKNTCMGQMWVAASLELGSYIPISSHRVRLRAGVYADYAFNIGNKEKNPLCNYDNVDSDPMTQNRTDLQTNLYMESLLHSNIYEGVISNLEVGLRITALIDVTSNHSRCMCIDNH